ncbi:uncharacterized protein LOC111519439 [Drosophila willistoni]|uniref:uncharacterized protein LOC111519439 n=1 Tax=Drosophila willistoni TaxID=7260 RepID=UPI001F0808CC|nr:uncharacterized protein LOC111519439 [Drosophila willistoni]
MHILELNDDCFGHILKFLPIQDHINVSQVCTVLRRAVQIWANTLYPTFYVNEIVTEEFELNTLRKQLTLLSILHGCIRTLAVNINHVDYHFYSSKQACSRNDQLSREEMNHKYLRLFRQKLEEPKELIPIDGFCNIIRKMQSLESLTISKNSFFYIPNPKIVNETILALRGLPKLRSLAIKTQLDINIDDLCEIKNLDTLHLEGDKNIDYLVKYCKSNGNLRVFHLHNCKINGNLIDIVPHCSKLEEISFRLCKDSNLYIKLADLPNLRTLHIRNLIDDNMSTFLKAFSQKQLQSLKFIETIVGVEDTQQIVKIDTLREIQLIFDDPEAVQLLAQLTKLQVISVKFRGNAGDFCAVALKILNSNRCLKYLRIAPDLGEEFRKDAFQLIKSIRNPEKQKPLHLEMPDIVRLSQDEEKLLDAKYMTFNRLPFYRWKSK